PILILVARSGGNVGMLARHALPRAWIAVLKRQAFGIGAVAQDHRVTTSRDRPQDVCPQHKTVVHGDRDVPVDVHPITDLRALLMGWLVLGRSRYPRFAFA